MICWFVESVDLGGIAYLMPVLGKYWNLSTVSLGYFGSISLLGMFIGSALAGVLADKFGRKKMIICCMLVWGVAGVGLACAWSVTSLCVFRFILGLGLGAQVPVAMTMLSEMCPSRIRGKYLALYMMFMPLGLSAAGLITYLVLPHYGWRGVFLAEALPALWCLVVWKFIPESGFWLESKSKFSDADRVISGIEEKLQKSTGEPLPPVQAGIPKDPAKEVDTKGLFWQLWKRPYISIMVMCFFWYFSSLVGYYGLTYWLSTLLVAKGFTVVKSSGVIAFFTLGALPGFFLANYLLNKIGRKYSITILCFATAIAAYIYGSSSTVVMVLATGFIFQFVQQGLGMCNTVYTPELFQTNIRGTGCGVALAMGRAGAIVGPILMAYVMSNYGNMAVFVAGAVVYVIAGLAVAILGPETKGKVF